MLPAPGTGDGRCGYYHFAADRTDEKPGRCDAHVQHGGWDRPFPQFIAEQSCRCQSQERCARGQNQAALFRTRVADQGGQRVVSAADQNIVLRHRRGALYFRVGTRFPPGVPPHPPDHQRYRCRAADRADRYGHAEGADGYPEESRYARCGRVQIVVQPA